jgi:hypothetical protein
MLGFGTLRLVWVKRNRDNAAATGTGSDVGTESLNAHGVDTLTHAGHRSRFWAVRVALIRSRIVASTWSVLLLPRSPRAASSYRRQAAWS